MAHHGVTADVRPRNERGVIAEHYHDLQSLGLVERARAARDVERASDESFLRTVLQAAEIALLNLADLVRRAATDLERGDVEGCAAKLCWLRGFHRVLIRLGIVAETHAAARAPRRGAAVARLGCGESPAFAEYFSGLRRLDAAISAWAERHPGDVNGALTGGSLFHPAFSLIHLTRIANHDSTTWERHLRAVAVPGVQDGWAEFIASETLREAVYEHQLVGDTYFTQFRALHQIPEILGAEINDCLEQAIPAARAGATLRALDALARANALAAGIEACLPVLVDNLTTHDYHEIRENLGLTSGSHSVGLRYHMFTQLYEQVCDELAAFGCRRSWGGPPTDAVAEAPSAPRGHEPAALSFLLGQVLAFRSFIFHWRAQHLHLPRNNLGGGGTRSLTGSPDAVEVVSRMSEHARSADPARTFFASPADLDAEPGPLTAYLRGEDSAYRRLLLATGSVTQEGFTDVQHRLGFFANRCAFRQATATRRLMRRRSIHASP